MSKCLGPPLSVYSSPLVIYCSPLVIYSCHLLDAFIKGLFKCFIHITDFFLYLFKHEATKFSQQLIVLFLNMFFQPFFFFMQMFDYMLHTQPYLFMEVLCHLCPSMFYGILLLKLIFHIIDIFTFIFWTNIFQCIFSYFPNFHILLHYLFFHLNSNVFIVFLNQIFFRCIQ